MIRVLNGLIGRKTMPQALKLSVFKPNGIQRTALKNQIKKHIEGHQHIPISILWSPTESGKTTLFKQIISEYNSVAKEREKEEDTFEYVHIMDPMMYPVASIPLSMPMKEKKVYNEQQGRGIKMVTNIMDDLFDPIVGSLKQGLEHGSVNRTLDMIKAMTDTDVVTHIISEHDRNQYVFVIDDFDAFYCSHDSNSLCVKTLLAALSIHAYCNKFKIVLLSSNPMIAADILERGKTSPQIMNMTQDIVSHNVDIKWTSEEIVNLIHNLYFERSPNLFEPMNDDEYDLIKNLSIIAGNPVFVKSLVASKYYLHCVSKCLNIQNRCPGYMDPMLNNLTQSHADQWELGAKLLVR